MPVPEQHTPEELRRVLPGWFAARMGADSVELTEIDVPKQGYPNETILLELDAVTRNDTEHASLVLRTQPKGHVECSSAEAN